MSSVMLGIPTITWPVRTGDDESLVVTFENLPYDAGRTWKAQIRLRRLPTSPLLAEAETESLEHDDGHQEVLLTLPAAVTRELPLGELAWDLQATDGDGTSTLAVGRLVVEADVTL